MYFFNLRKRIFHSASEVLLVLAISSVSNYNLPEFSFKTIDSSGSFQPVTKHGECTSAWSFLFSGTPLLAKL